LDAVRAARRQHHDAEAGEALHVRLQLMVEFQHELELLAL